MYRVWGGGGERQAGDGRRVRVYEVRAAGLEKEQAAMAKTRTKKRKVAAVRTRLRSVVGHEYPVGESLARVKRAGGLRNLTEEEVATLDVRKVPPGGWCDDIPEECCAAFLARGKIEEVEVDSKGKPLRETVGGGARRKAGG